MPSASKKASLTHCQNSIHAPSSYSPSFHSFPKYRGIASPMPSVMIYHLAAWVRRCFYKQTTAILSPLVHVVTMISVKWRGIKTHCSWMHQIPLDYVFWVICVCNRNNAVLFSPLPNPMAMEEKISSSLVYLPSAKGQVWQNNKVPSVRQD